MANKEKIGWLLGAAVLVLLFLLSSTDLLIKEKEREITPLSVIIGDANDDYYGNFKKGMDMAAQKYQADVKFITLYEENDEAQQMELLRREIRDGARAVILSPVKKAETVMELEAAAPRCPVIFLEAAAESGAVSASVSPDYYEMGRTLGEKLAEREAKETTVCLLTEGLSYGENGAVYDGVRPVLEAAGFETRLVEKKNGDTYRKVIEETVYPEQESILILAMDTKALSEAAEIVAASSVYQEQVKGIYGIGSTIGILNRLEKGIIKGIMAWNQFDEGYLSVERAMEAVGGVRTAEELPMEAFYIEGADLYQDAYERMLYPKE